METIHHTSLQKRYMEAINSFVDKIKPDPNIIAVIVCGSLAYDTVWEKSDIDTTVIVRDQHLSRDSYCILEDDIVVNVSLITRSAFKRNMEGSIGGSFTQSYYSKGKVVYSTDESLSSYFEEMKAPGADDLARSIFYCAGEVISLYEKAQKWLFVKEDPLYAQYYLLKAATPLAYMIVCLSGDSPSRECIQKALELDGQVLAPFYQNAMSHHLSTQEIQSLIVQIDTFLTIHLDRIMEPVAAFMADGEMKTVTMFSKYFHAEGHFLIGLLDYLEEKGAIEKATQTIRVTPKGRMAVEEIAYLYMPAYHEIEYGKDEKHGSPYNH